MASGKELPPNSHVIRRAKKAQALPNGPPTAAFELRHGDPEISVRWLEFFSAVSSTEQFTLTCRALSANMDLANSDRVLLVDVDKARGGFLEELESVRVMHDPIDPDDCSHAVVEGVLPLTDRNRLLVAQILALAVTDNKSCEDLRAQGMIPARDRK
jgi:hypothetical protein